MPERYERVIRIVCLILAAILVAELANALFRHNPLDRVKIPELPTLAGETATNSTSAKTKEKPGTNITATVEKADKDTNAVVGGATNQATSNAVSISIKEANGTNSAPVLTSVTGGTNTVVSTNAVGETNLVSATNKISGTNVTKGTNAVATPGPGKQARIRNKHNGPAKAAELPPVIQARIDKIVDSEILGPVNRPMPMGLLGIAGEYAFLRSSSGQTGMVKKGDDLGGLKLLEIGVNRVLVEEGGEKRELTIFDGYGSETLLPKTNDKPNETIKKPK